MYIYKFPAVKGVQAGREYFIAMIPLQLLNKLFISESDDIDPEFRAQRKINLNRIPVIAEYILNNRQNYVFSALAASIDGDFRFVPTEGINEMGYLEISMNSKFLLNDGQHRKAAIDLAIQEDPSLLNESISIVFYKDMGLKMSQQMFTDLNKHAVITSKSLNALYDIRDQVAVMTKESIDLIPFFKKYTELEKDNLGKYSGRLFTLNNIYKANLICTKDLNLRKIDTHSLVKFWQGVIVNVNEWNELEAGQLSKKALREEYIVTQGIVLHAFGKLGNYLFKNSHISQDDVLKNLKNIDWSRTNIFWRKAMMRDGRIIKSESSIKTTYILIKKFIGLDLTDPEEQKVKSIERM